MQSQKARSPIEMTDDGILTFLNDEHPLNESCQINVQMNVIQHQLYSCHCKKFDEYY